MLSFGKFMLKYYSSTLNYWKINLIIFLFISIFILRNNSIQLKLILFLIINLFVIIYFFSSFQLAKCWNLKQIYSSSVCVKNWSSATTQIINIFLLFGFTIIISLLTIFRKENMQEQQITICFLGLLVFLIFYIYGYLLTQIRNLYISLNILANKNNYIIPPNNNVLILGWGILLFTTLILFCIYQKSQNIAFKSIICILIVFFYLYYSIGTNLNYLKENNFSILTKK